MREVKIYIKCKVRVVKFCDYVALLMIRRSHANLTWIVVINCHRSFFFFFFFFFFFSILPTPRQSIFFLLEILLKCHLQNSFEWRGNDLCECFWYWNIIWCMHWCQEEYQPTKNTLFFLPSFFFFNAPFRKLLHKNCHFMYFRS